MGVCFTFSLSLCVDKTFLETVGNILASANYCYTDAEAVNAYQEEVLQAALQCKRPSISNKGLPKKEKKLKLLFYVVTTNLTGSVGFGISRYVTLFYDFTGEQLLNVFENGQVFHHPLIYFVCFPLAGSVCYP